MKIIASSDGKEKIKISKDEWIAIGKKTGWLNKKAALFGTETAEGADAEADVEEVQNNIANLEIFMRTGAFEAKFKEDIIEEMTDRDFDLDVDDIGDQEIKKYLFEKIKGNIRELKRSYADDAAMLQEEFEDALAIKKENNYSPIEVKGILIEDIDTNLSKLDEAKNFVQNNIPAKIAKAEANKIYDYLKTKIIELNGVDPELARNYLEQLKALTAAFKMAFNANPQFAPVESEESGEIPPDTEEIQSPDVYQDK